MNAVFAAHGNIISPVGFSAEENFHALTRLKSGISLHTEHKFLSFPFYASLLNTGMLNDKFSVSANQTNYTRLEKMFILSIADVIGRSGLDVKNERTLLIISTTKGNVNLLEEENFGGFPEARLLLAEMANTIAQHFTMKNKPLVISNACISGVLAIIIAQRLIRSGQYDNILVSGGDLVSAFTLSGFNSFKAMSDEPCRPFDIARKGITLGEGCGTLLLTSDSKSIDTEEKKINVSGGGVSNDANHISGPSRTGEELALAIRNALSEAKVGKKIDFISAHGTATLFNDEMEANAFSVAGLEQVPLNSMKGFFGHTLGAAGVIEAVATLESMKKNKLIPSMGYESPGVTMPLNIITETEERELNHCLKTASGFGGCNAAVVFSKE